jgi:hypothetical protein
MAGAILRHGNSGKDPLQSKLAKRADIHAEYFNRYKTAGRNKENFDFRFPDQPIKNKLLKGTSHSK